MNISFWRKSIIDRALKNNWLETHLFHAKRFRMKKAFGYTLAINRLDKGFKACYRYAKYNNCIYDSSYFNYFLIESEDTFLTFQSIINTFTIDTLLEPKLLNCYKVNFYFSNKLIGPVVLMILRNCILVQFHPLMRKEMGRALSGFRKISFCDKINNFTLIGPGSEGVLYKVLKSITNSCSFPEINTSLNEDEFSKNLHFMMENQGLVFKVRKPTSKFRMNEFIFNSINSLIISEEKQDNTFNNANTDSQPQLNENDYNAMINIFKYKSVVFDSSVDFDLNIDMDMDIPTERTVFQHRKNVNLEKLNEKLKKSQSIGLKNKNSSVSMKMQVKKSKNKNSININSNLNCELNLQQELKHSKDSLIQFISCQEETFFILTKSNVEKVENNKYQVYPTYNLIFPHGLATNLIRRFTYLQSRLIGLSEFNHYLSDTTRLIFPNDYPSTESYRKYRESKTIEKINKYCKYPASKRVNFQKIGNPSPFYAAWHRLEIESSDSNKLKPAHNPASYSSFLYPNLEIVHDLSNKTKIKRQFQIQNIIDPTSKRFIIPVQIEMTGKGMISYNSLICLPTIDDLRNYRDIITTGVNSSNFVAKILSECEQSTSIELISTYKLSKDKIIEPKHFIKAKNKNFAVEYNTITNLNKTSETQTLLYESEILEMDLTIKLESPTVRKVIGFVTSGGFSYSQGKSVGRGFICTSYYETLMKLKCESKLNLQIQPNMYLLVRNRTSRIYYMAKMKVLSI